MIVEPREPIFNNRGRIIGQGYCPVCGDGTKRDDLGMSPNHWLAAKGLWEDFSDFEKQIYREVSGLQAQDFRDTIKPEGC